MAAGPVGRGGAAESGAMEMAPRVATAITAWVFAMHTGNLLLAMVRGTDAPPPPPGPSAVAVALVATLFVLQMLQTAWVGRAERRRAARIVLAVQVGLVYLPSHYFGSVWFSVAGFDLGSALLVLRGPPRVLAAVGLTALLAVHSYGDTASLSLLASDLVYIVATGLVVFGVSQLRMQVHELHAARDDLAQATLTHQRLAHQRRLYAQVGRCLSEVGLRAVLARRLLADRPEQAQRELDTARTAARTALANARETARSHRTAPGPQDTPAPPSGTALHRAWVLLAAVVTAYAAARAAQVLHIDVYYDVQRPAAETAVALLCIAAVAGLVLPQVRWAGRPARRHAARLVLAVQAVLAVLPLAAFGLTGAVLANMLAASLLLVLRPRLRWAAFALVGIGVAVAAHRTAPDLMHHLPIVALNGGLAVYGLARLLLMVRERQEVRHELADTVRANERLRFARDVHDLLGYSLSALTLKLDLAHRLAAAEPGRAREEIDHALSAARTVGADTRSITQGDVALSLDGEAAAVRGVLESAGAAVRMSADPGPLPPPIETALALVLREATANLLRHSTATEVRIGIRRHGDGVALDVTNNGAAAPGAPSGGLANLTYRAALLGGTLHTSHDEDEFRLECRLPLTPPTGMTDSPPAP